jgi:hypothetical protein
MLLIFNALIYKLQYIFWSCVIIIYIVNAHAGWEQEQDHGAISEANNFTVLDTTLIMKTPLIYVSLIWILFILLCILVIFMS